MEQEVHSIVKTEEEKKLYNTAKYTTEITKLLSSIHIFLFHFILLRRLGMCNNSRECLFVSFTSAVSIIIAQIQC